MLQDICTVHLFATDINRDLHLGPFKTGRLVRSVFLNGLAHDQRSTGEVAEFDVAELGFELYLLFATGRRVARFTGEICWAGFVEAKHWMNIGHNKEV